jgi:hypothetical protein
MGVIVELKLAVVPDRMVWKVVNLVSGSQVQADVDRFVADPMSVDGYNTLYSIFLGAGIRTYPKDVSRGRSAACVLMSQGSTPPSRAGSRPPTAPPWAE